MSSENKTENKADDKGIQTTVVVEMVAGQKDDAPDAEKTDKIKMGAYTTRVLQFRQQSRKARAVNFSSMPISIYTEEENYNRTMPFYSSRADKDFVSHFTLLHKQEGTKELESVNTVSIVYDLTHGLTDKKNKSDIRLKPIIFNIIFVLVAVPAFTRNEYYFSVGSLTVSFCMILICAFYTDCTAWNQAKPRLETYKNRMIANLRTKVEHTTPFREKKSRLRSPNDSVATNRKNGRGKGGTGAGAGGSSNSGFFNRQENDNDSNGHDAGNGGVNGGNILSASGSGNASGNVTGNVSPGGHAQMVNRKSGHGKGLREQLVVTTVSDGMDEYEEDSYAYDAVNKEYGIELVIGSNNNTPKGGASNTANLSKQVQNYADAHKLEYDPNTRANENRCQDAYCRSILCCQCCSWCECCSDSCCTYDVKNYDDFASYMFGFESIDKGDPFNNDDGGVVPRYIQWYLLAGQFAVLLLLFCIQLKTILDNDDRVWLKRCETYNDDHDVETGACLMYHSATSACVAFYVYAGFVSIFVLKIPSVSSQQLKLEVEETIKVRFPERALHKMEAIEAASQNAVKRIIDYQWAPWIDPKKEGNENYKEKCCCNCDCCCRSCRSKITKPKTPEKLSKLNKQVSEKMKCACCQICLSVCGLDKCGFTLYGIPFGLIFVFCLCSFVSLTAMYVKDNHIFWGVKNNADVWMEYWTANVIYAWSRAIVAFFFYRSISELWLISHLFTRDRIAMESLGGAMYFSSLSDVVCWFEMRSFYVHYQQPTQSGGRASPPFACLLIGSLASGIYALVRIYVFGDDDFLQSDPDGAMALAVMLVIFCFMFLYMYISVSTFELQLGHIEALKHEKLRLTTLQHAWKQQQKRRKQKFYDDLEDCENENSEKNEENKEEKENSSECRENDKNGQIKRKLKRYREEENPFEGTIETLNAVITYLGENDRPPTIIGIPMTKTILITGLGYLIGSTGSIIGLFPALLGTD